MLRTKPHALDVASASGPRLAPWPDSSAKEFWRQVAIAKSMCAHTDLVPKDGPTRLYLDIMCAASESNDSTEERAKREVYAHFIALPENVRLAVYNELDLMEKLVDLRERITTSKDASSKAWSAFNGALPEFQEKWHEVVRRSKLVPLPPSTSTPNNLEALLMANAYVMEPMAHFSVDDDCQQAAHEAALTLVEHLAPRTPSLYKLVIKTDAAFKSAADIEAVSAAHFFSVAWMRSGFAKLEIGHKLAASLALTDVPDDIEVQAPWHAWSLVLPPGLFGEEEHFARVWCMGTSPRFVVGDSGWIAGPITRDMVLPDTPTSNPLGRAVMVAINSLVRGCCLALSNPDDYRKHRTSSASVKPKRERSGEPDFGATRFLLSAPITIDMRTHLLDTIRGKRTGGGGSPTVQFLVRGHWRNQAHGPGRSLRKQIRIEPFWKGDENARVLLRNYKTKEDQ